MPSPLFSQRLARDLVFQHRFGEQLLQAAVLGFQAFQPLGIGDTHAAKLAAPKVVARLREAVPSAQLLDREARFMSAFDPNRK